MQPPPPKELSPCLVDDVQAGDKVQVSCATDSTKWLSATVCKKHPSGTYKLKGPECFPTNKYNCVAGSRMRLQLHQLPSPDKQASNKAPQHFPSPNTLTNMIKTAVVSQ